jgi:hypothetical protein
VVQNSPKEAIAIAGATTSRLVWSPEERAHLKARAQSRTAEIRRVERARVLLADAKTPSCSQAARTLQLSRTKVTRCVLSLCVLSSELGRFHRGHLALVHFWCPCIIFGSPPAGAGSGLDTERGRSRVWRFPRRQAPPRGRSMRPWRRRRPGRRQAPTCVVLPPAR